MNCSHPPPPGKETSGVENENRRPSAFEEAQESALFGHEPGGTVYATGWRRGYLDIADTGTLVLDHVDHLVPKVQTLLLRYLQSSRFSRIGSDQERKSEVRIIATATEDMEAMVEQGRFNGELLELLRGRVITIIPLRERREDIPAMVQDFLARYKRKNQDRISRFSKGAMNALVNHGWPLNLAELNSVLSQAVAACQGATIEEEHIFLDIRFSLSPSAGKNLLKEKDSAGFCGTGWSPADLSISRSLSSFA